jgi:transposase-like protein
MPVKDVQIVTAVERRRKWSEEEKAAIVSESLPPSGTVIAVARKYDLHPRVIYYWRAKLFGGQSGTDPAPSKSWPALPAPAPKGRGRLPKNSLPASPIEVTPAPRVFAVEAAPPTAVTAGPDSVRLVVGDLVITISTGGKG